ncbi:MAG: hypothetical protein AAF321_04080 [Pseudomonadota bacterium]
MTSWNRRPVIGGAAGALVASSLAGVARASPRIRLVEAPGEAGLVVPDDTPTPAHGSTTAPHPARSSAHDRAMS